MQRAGRTGSVILCALVLGNCAGIPNRLNHLHSEHDQKLMDTAVSSFKTVTDDATGVQAQRRINLKAETDFRRVISAKQIFNNDEQDMSAIYGRLWRELVAEATKKVGQPLQAGDTPRDGLERINRQLPLIRAQLGTIADTLGALGAAESAIQAEMLEQVKAARKAVEALAPNTVTTSVTGGTPTKPELFQQFLSAYRQYREALDKAGKEYIDQLSLGGDDPALKRASEIQVELLKAAAASRDPEAVYSIVAAVGTGLDETTLAMLQTYREALEKALAGFRDRTKRSGEATERSNVRRPRADVPTVKERVLTARVRPHSAELKTASARARLAGPAARIEEFFIAVDEITEKPNPRSEAETFSTPFLGRAVTSDTSTANQPIFTRDALGMLKLRSADRADLAQRVGVELQTLRTMPVRQKDAPRDAAAEQTAAPLKRAAFLATTKAELTDGLVNATLIRAAKVLDQQLGPKETTELVKTIGSIVDDIFKEAPGHEQRVAQYLADVLSVGVDLHGENRRHYDALSMILGRELERWELVTESLQALLRNFSDPVEQWPPHLPLFIADSVRFDDSLPAGAALHSPVSHDDRVFTSLRAITAAAKAWQGADPALLRRGPPPGPEEAKRKVAVEQAYASNLRARRAVEVLSGYLFLVSMNGRFATEDAVQLHSEIAEHNIGLDSVEARAVEAKLRYDLTELQAYHASGITAADLQTILQAIQTGLLGWIGGKVN